MGFSFVIPMKAKVYPLGDKWRVVLWYDGKQYSRIHYDDNFALVTKEMAEFICTGINADINEKGKGFDPRSWFRQRGADLRFNEYVKKWAARQDPAPSCIPKLRLHVRLFTEFFKNQNIKTIRKAHIREFLDTLPQAPKTKRDILGSLHKIFSDAFSDEDIERIPGFPTVTIKDKVPETIPPQEVERILESIPDRDRPIFLLMARYGVRPAEARALMWEDVDFNRAEITVRRTYSGQYLKQRTKTGRERILPITLEIESILKPLRGLSGHVFRNQWGRPYGSTHIWEIWHKASGGAINLYNGTKHSLGKKLLDQGASIELVRQMFGHTDVRMTRRYAEASVGTVRKMLEK